MNTYQPLTGPAIAIGHLAADDAIIVFELISKAFGRQPQITAAAFLTEARLHLRQRFPREMNYRRAMRGPVGSVFRDLFYRLTAVDLEGKPEHQKLLDNLQYNPLRLLLDCFIEGGWGQSEFAGLAGLNKTTVSKIVNQLLGKSLRRDEDEGSSLSIARFRDACKRLGINPLYNEAQPLTKTDVVFEPPLTSEEYLIGIRERQMYRLVAMAAKSRDTKKVRGLIISHLLLIYGIRDMQRAEMVADAVLKDIRDVAVDVAGANTTTTLADLVGFAIGTSRSETYSTFDFLSGTDSDELMEDSQWDRVKAIFNAVRSHLESTWAEARRKFRLWEKPSTAENEVLAPSPLTPRESAATPSDLDRAIARRAQYKQVAELRPAA